MATSLGFLRPLLESYALDNVTDYVGRGRRHREVPTDQLKTRWVAAFRRLALSPDPEAAELEALGELDDLEAELRLRHACPPGEQVEAEWRMLHDKICRRMRDEPDELRPQN